MEILKDLYFTNKEVVKKASKLFIDNWIIVFTGFIYTTINIVLLSIIGIFFRGIFGIIGGILMFLVMSALVSNYLYLLYKVTRFGKITVQDFKYGFKAFLTKVYSIFFILWFAGLLFNRVILPILSTFIPAGILSTVISILVLILLNSLPESIYQKFYDSWETVVYSFNFTKENWIEWFIPNIILMGILYFLTGQFISDIFTIQISFSAGFSFSSIILYIIGQVLFSFIMIYRGVLFDILSTSTRRKRLFKRNMYR